MNAPLAVQIRDSTDADIAAIQAIYGFYVLKSAATFEEVPPTLEQIAERRSKVVKLGLPYLVAESDGEILGYCYAGPFRPRSAYRYTLEDSIYVAPGVARRGIGHILMGELVRRCTESGFRQMIAVIGDSANLASIAVHRRHGFRQEGVLRGVGLKFGRWVDVVIMHRPLGKADAALPGVDEPGLDLPQE